MRKITAFAGLGLATALALTGCSAAAPAATDDSMSSETAVVDTVNSDGAGLRAAIQAKKEHVPVGCVDHGLYVRGNGPAPCRYGLPDHPEDTIAIVFRPRNSD